MRQTMSIFQQQPKISQNHRQADCRCFKEEITADQESSISFRNDRQKEILQGVSRSFALTIPNLPTDLCRTVTNAYLLCRIADTIEDEENLTLSQKHFFFQEFMNVVNGKADADQFSAGLYPLLGSNTLAAEKELIQNVPMVMRIFFTLKQEQQAATKRCLEIMSSGMLHFQKTRNLNGLEKLSDMDNYCYHVAGVVGEMLTDLFCDYSEKISKNRDKLIGLAASFGQGLQMTNILKDLWEDRERGWCWLPQDVFKKAGFDLQNLSAGNHSPGFGKGLSELIGTAHAHLKNALTYTLLMPRNETGIRKFCLWAIGMALLTLKKINGTRNYSCGDDVKISRKSVRKIIMVTNVTVRNNFLLKTFFKFTANGLPRQVQ
jgi:farnesyl-diphosphate farnesyltransferase